ncbi:MAG: hypothetical protein M0P59_04095 [Gallionella sp.]|jgi:hypothetical protein|nr:hypothetical protein [Gallionella sp.]MCK9353321.1 hypothetical protein [Gallionella sp.]
MARQVFVDSVARHVLQRMLCRKVCTVKWMRAAHCSASSKGGINYSISAMQHHLDYTKVSMLLVGTKANREKKRWPTSKQTPPRDARHI